MVQKLGFNVSLSIGPHTCIFSHIHVCIFFSGRQTAKSGNVDPSDFYDYDFREQAVTNFVSTWSPIPLSLR